MTFAWGGEKLTGCGVRVIAAAALSISVSLLTQTVVGCARSASVAVVSPHRVPPTVVATSGDQTATGSTESLESVVFVRRGRPLVLAVAPTSEDILRGSVEVTIDDAAAISAPLYRLAAEPVAETELPQRRLAGNEPAQLGGLERAWGWLATARQRVRWRAVPPTGEAGPTEIGAVSRTSAGRPAGGVGVQEFGSSTWIAVVHLPARQPPSGVRTIAHGQRTLRIVPFDDQASRSPGLRRPHTASPWAEAAVGAALDDPFLRWRARLALGRLAGPAGETGDEFADRVVELLARQFEAPVVAALARLTALDAVLADRLVGVIAGWVDFGGGLLLPVWWSGPSDGGFKAEGQTGSLAELLQAIVPGPGALTDALVKERVTAFLNASPTVAVWVSDDAMPVNEVGRAAAVGTKALSSSPSTRMSDPQVAVTLGVANLSTEHTAGVGVNAADEDDPNAGSAGAMVQTPPRQGRFINLKTGEPGAKRILSRENSNPSGLRELLVTSGKARLRRGVIGCLRGAVPPGVVLGPVLPDWTHDRWLDACTSAGLSGGLIHADPALPVVAGLLYRVDGEASREVARSEPPGANQAVVTGQPASRWVVYLEVAEPAENTSDITQHAAGVELHFGPRGKSLGVASVSRDPSGNTVIRWRFPTAKPAGAEASREFTSLDVLTPNGSKYAGTHWAWRAWIPVPSRCLDEAGNLQVGMVLGTDRLRSSGRAAWPRPMMPWETEPARLSVDLSTWSGLAP